MGMAPIGQGLTTPPGARGHAYANGTVVGQGHCTAGRRWINPIGRSVWRRLQIYGSTWLQVELLKIVPMSFMYASLEGITRNLHSFTVSALLPATLFQVLLV